MCAIMQQYEDIARKEGIQQGVQQGMQQGSVNSFTESVKGIMQALGYTADKAMLIANVPEEYRQAVLAKV